MLWIGFLINCFLAVVFSFYVMTRRREPVITLAWILTFFFLPFLGVFLYFVIGYQRIRQRKKHKPEPGKRAQSVGTGQSPAEPSEQEGPPADPPCQAIARLAANLTGFPTTSGNEMSLYQDANRSYAVLAQAIEQARHHIHLEFFVFQPDDTGRYFRDLLIRQARKGIECRLLADSVGSWRLGQKFIRPMREAGVRVSFFWPVRLLRRPWGFHLRNHRKIAVIDGRTGFMGSQNIGNEYLRFGGGRISWQDAFVRVEGPVVGQIQTIFTEDWAFTTHEELKGSNYYPILPLTGNHQIQTLPTGPDQNEHALQLIFIGMIQAAQKSVLIMTPYFVPTQAMALALEGAARRGVDVSVVLPAHSDSPLTWRAGRSWYRFFLECGVGLYEHADRFIHAKVVAVDDDVALVGSANMDVRSFLINFESSLLVYGAQSAKPFRIMIEEMAGKSIPIHLTDIDRQSTLESLAEGFCRLLSPLL